MKFINPSAAVLITLFILSLIAGCSRNDIDRTTWLIIIAEDTITVSELGEAWNEFDERQREIFTSKDNVIGEYIVTQSRKALLLLELEEAGYLDDIYLLSYSRAWFDSKLSEAAGGFLYEKELEIITDDEIDFFLNYLGRHVRYTENPGSEIEQTYGPIHIPLLSTEMIIFIENLTIGEIGITESGVEVRLDSIITADSSLIIQALADTAVVRSNAAATIATRRYEEMLDSLKQSLHADYDLCVDSTALERLRLYYSEEADLPPGETVIFTSDLGILTAEEMRGFIAYYQSRYSINPADQVWINEFIDLVQYNYYCRDLLENESPLLVDSLRIESEKYLLDVASEEFYNDRIQSTVTVTRADMEDLFENLEEPFTFPEKRILQAIHMPDDSVIVYHHLSQDERDEFILRMPGFGYLAAEPTLPQITKPLSVNQVPGFHGDEVFLIDPADTIGWLGPLDLYDGDLVCMFRLIEVIPERFATFDEVEDRLRVMTRNRLEEQATIVVIRELEEKYGLVINEDILEKLPEDPGSWVEL